MTTTVFRLGGARVDLDRKVAERAGEAQRLSPLEARLLGYLAARAGQLVSRDALLVDVWGYRPGLQTRAVDNTVRRLRKKVEADPAAPVHLQSVYGGGYLLEGVVPLGGADGPPLPELVGRDELVRTLAGPGRGLVALVGPAGVGKSALAVVIAGAEARVVDVEGRDADGAWAALGVALGAPGRPEDVRSVLMHRGVPLVVEGLAPGSAASAAVEDWGRRVRVCVPSRAPLALAGARVVPVPPLEPIAAQALLAARAARHGPHDAEALRALGARLGGLPLAIELAATRLGTFTPTELAARLDARLDVLAAADPGRPPEHRSLRALLDHAWAELDGDQRAGLRALSTLGPRFPPDAAEAALGGVSGALVLDGLRARGLVRRRVVGGRSRLWLDPAVRAYAAERAARADDRAPVLARRLAWARGRCVAAFSPMTSGLGEAAPALEAALLDADAPDIALEIALALAPAWRAAGTLDRLIDGLGRAAAAAPDHRWAAAAGVWRAEALLGRGEVAAARAVLDACVSCPEPRTATEARALRGRLHVHTGELPAAAADLAAALEAARAGGFEGLEARIACEQGLVRRYLGDPSGAVEAHLRAARVLRGRGDRVAAAQSQSRAGLALRDAGQLAEAEQHLRAAAEDLAQVGDTQRLASARMNLGAIHAQQGRRAEATAAYAAALEGHRRAGNRRGEAACLLNLGLAQLHAGDTAAALVDLRVGRELAEAVGVPRFAAVAQAALGVAWLCSGEAARACTALDAAEARLAAAGYPAALQRYAAWARVARAAAGRPPGPPVAADGGAAPFVGLVERALAAGLRTPDPAPEGPLDEDAALLLTWLAGRA